jgi:hypothetical protein
VIHKPSHIYWWWLAGYNLGGTLMASEAVWLTIKEFKGNPQIVAYIYWWLMIMIMMIMMIIIIGDNNDNDIDNNNDDWLMIDNILIIMINND